MISLAVIIPALFVTICIIFVWIILRNIVRLFWRVSGWAVINGYWFPETMRADRKYQTLKAERNSRNLDLLTKRVSEARTQEEVDEIYSLIDQIPKVK